MNPFKKATKQAAKLRLSIAGPSGSGKTFTALAIGTALGGPVAVIDTEHGSASKYADLFQFDVVELAAPFHPDRFIEMMYAAADAGYEVLIVDSLSHAWNGPGGILEIVDQMAARQKSANSYTAWKDATPIHNRLIEAIVAAPVHIIATMRSKQEYVLEENERGKKVPRKIGMAPIQRDGMEYEFDVFAEMDMENRMLVQKSRCSALQGAVIQKPGADVSAQLLKWLDGDPPPAVQPSAPDQPASGDGAAVQTARPMSKGEISQAAYDPNWQPPPPSVPVTQGSLQGFFTNLGFKGQEHRDRRIAFADAVVGGCTTFSDLSDEQRLSVYRALQFVGAEVQNVVDFAGFIMSGEHPLSTRGEMRAALHAYKAALSDTAAEAVPPQPRQAPARKPARTTNGSTRARQSTR